MVESESNAKSSGVNEQISNAIQQTADSVICDKEYRTGKPELKTPRRAWSTKVREMNHLKEVMSAIAENSKKINKITKY